MQPDKARVQQNPTTTPEKKESQVHSGFVRAVVTWAGHFIIPSGYPCALSFSSPEAFNICHLPEIQRQHALKCHLLNTHHVKIL